MRPRYRKLPQSVRKGEPASATQWRAGDAEPTKAVKGTGDACHLCGGTGWQELDIPRGFVARCQCQEKGSNEQNRFDI
jgi:hypothetical protein